MSIERRYSLLKHRHDGDYYTETEIDAALALYLPLTGGELSGNLVLGNNLAVRFDTSGGTPISMLDFSGSDVLFVGDQSYETRIEGSVIKLYDGATNVFNTQLETSDGEGTAAEVLGSDGTMYPVGTLVRTRYSVGTSESLTLSQDLLTRSIYGAASGVTITTPASTDTTLQDGSEFPIFNLGANTISVVAGSGVTLYGISAGTLTGPGTRTIGGRSYAIIYRVTASVWLVWGDSIT